MIEPLAPPPQLPPEVADLPAAPAYVYLLCFAQTPYRHAAHYLEATSQPLAERLAAHAGDGRYGRPAPLLRALVAAGGHWEVADVWPCQSAVAATQLERQLRRQGHRGRLCSICHPGRRFRAGTVTVRMGESGGEK